MVDDLASRKQTGLQLSTAKIQSCLFPRDGKSNLYLYRADEKIFGLRIHNLLHTFQFATKQNKLALKPIRAFEFGGKLVVAHHKSDISGDNTVYPKI